MQHYTKPKNTPLKGSSTTVSSSSTSLTPQMKSTSILKFNTKANEKFKTKKPMTQSRNYNSRNQKPVTNNHKNPISGASSSSANGPPTTNSLASSVPYPVSPVSQYQAPSKYWRGGKGGKHTNTTGSNSHEHNHHNQNHSHNPYRNKKNGSVGGNNSNSNHHSYHHQNYHHLQGELHHGHNYFVKNTGNVGKSKPNNNHHNNHHNRFRYNGNSNVGQQNLARIFNKQHGEEKKSLPWFRDEKVDIALTDELTSSLEAHGVFEDRDGTRKRRRVLSNLKRLITHWSADNFLTGTGQKSYLNESGPHQNFDGDTYQQKQHEGKYTATIIAPQLISFGSYRLGVHLPTADLDVLALCPSHSTRDKFFSTLIVRLNRDSRVEGLHPIPGAYTPVIKFYMDGIAIDLVFVRLVDDSKLVTSYDNNKDETREDDENTPLVFHSESLNENTAPCIGRDSSTTTNNTNDHGILSPLSKMIQPQRIEFELDDSMLVGLDEPSVRSLNGVRVAQHLLMLIPNLPNFRLVLRTVKAWALIHGLYSNVLGFLGGINWAILVSFICMRNKEASPPQLLRIFFITFSKWKWPKPVTLVPILHNPPSGVMPLQVWNPTINPRDGAHLMPIITPAYPSMNSSYNVGQSQLRRLKEEMCRAVYTLTQIAKYRGTTTTPGGYIRNEKRCCWDDLLKGNDFFHSHVHYLHVTIRATNAAHFRSWFGFCESRLRILIAGLESPELGVQAYPFAKIFGPDHECGGDGVDIGGGSGENNKDSAKTMEASFFVALRFAYGVESIDLKSCTEEFAYRVNSWVERKDTMDVTISHVFQHQLPSYVFKTYQPIDKMVIDEDEDTVVQPASELGNSTIAETPTTTTTNSSPSMKCCEDGVDDNTSTSIVQQEGQIKSGTTVENLTIATADPSPLKRRRTGVVEEEERLGTDADSIAENLTTTSTNPSPLKKLRTVFEACVEEDEVVMR